jgi:hypothetical protein
VQHQLYVAGAAQGWLVFYADGAALLEFPIARDEAFLTGELIPQCLAFWERITARKPPPLDPKRDLYVPAGEAFDHWALLAGDYRDILREKARLDATLKATTTEMTRLQRALLGMMGEFLTGEAAGLRVTRYLQSGAIDYGRALKALCPTLDGAALEAYRKRSAERVRITPLSEESAGNAEPPVPVGKAAEALSDSFFF